MEFDELLKLVDADPVFESSLLLAGNINPKNVRLQLTRWVNSGRIIQLRRGLYSLAPPYQKVQPHPFLVANHLQRSSYVSLHSALAFYGLIPETVNITISVTPGRPERLETPLGNFEFRHIKPRLLKGYQMVDMGGQNALVATPEKALLDLIYFQPGSADPSYLEGLRLQNLGNLDLSLLEKHSGFYDSKKMNEAVKAISGMITEEKSEYEDL